MMVEADLELAERESHMAAPGAVSPREDRAASHEDRALPRLVLARVGRRHGGIRRKACAASYARAASRS